jgi:hypothetical protein
MGATCASECLYPSAKLHSCTLQKFVQSVSQNSYISVSEHFSRLVKPLNAKLNPICHLLALLGAHFIFHVNGIRVKQPIHEKRTVHNVPERVTRARFVRSEMSFWEKNIKRPRSLSHKDTHVVTVPVLNETKALSSYSAWPAVPLHVLMSGKI